MGRELVKKSRYLSLILRHRPEAVGLKLGRGGWVDVDVLLQALSAHGRGMSRDELTSVVEQNDKRRFSFSEDGRRIRANQGHSIPVDLGLQPTTPPPRLYHGTVERALSGIMRNGLQRKSRHHVHLSPDTKTARKVGARRGEPLILEIDAAAMAAAGHEFFVSENGVWLTESVPVQFLSLLEE
jgi:putative RNA 2'-phosphotransferase